MRILGDSSALKINVLEIRTLSQTQTSRGEHNYVELPSMEQIVEIEKQQSNAKESLEISDGHVKCQACGILQPIITDNTKLIDSNGSRRVHQLRATIKRIERYHINGISAKKEKQELDELLEEQRKKDLLRRIPLYSTPVTDHRWVCSSCYDKAYWLSRRTKKGRQLKMAGWDCIVNPYNRYHDEESGSESYQSEERGSASYQDIALNTLIKHPSIKQDI